MDRLEEIRIFCRVVEAASFTKAASTLQMARSSVSTAVQGLEARLGARLLNRTTRKVVVTEDGAAFHERCVRLLADLEEAEALVRSSSERPRGRVRVNVPGRLGRLVIAPALPGFLEEYPDIEVEFGVTDRAIDLVHEGVDFVVRVGELADSSLVARRLGELVLRNCASPGYLARHGTPARPEDLTGHFAVGYASPVTGRLEEWEYRQKEGTRAMRLPSRVVVDSAEAYIACCLAGLGLIQIPLYDVRSHIVAGELAVVMPGFDPPPMPLSLVFPHRRHSSRRVEVFADWLTKLFREHLLAIPA